MDSICYVNEIYKITHHWESSWIICKTHLTPYEIVSSYDGLKDGF